jgi:hypothetical protein
MLSRAVSDQIDLRLQKGQVKDSMPGSVNRHETFIMSIDFKIMIAVILFQPKLISLCENFVHAQQP